MDWVSSVSRPVDYSRSLYWHPSLRRGRNRETAGVAGGTSLEEGNGGNLTDWLAGRLAERPIGLPPSGGEPSYLTTYSQAIQCSGIDSDLKSRVRVFDAHLGTESSLEASQESRQTSGWVRPAAGRVSCIFRGEWSGVFKLGFTRHSTATRGIISFWWAVSSGGLWDFSADVSWIIHC